MTATRSYLSGFGLHTTLGRGVAANLKALAAPIAPPGSVTFEYATRSETLPYYLLHDEPLNDGRNRWRRVVTGAINEALDAAQLGPAQRRDIALFVGTSSGEISAHEAEFRDDLMRTGTAVPLASSRGLGNITQKIVEQFGFRGPDFTVNTACTASANALMHADALIRSGQIDRALVVGLEICNTVTALGFQGLQLLTNDLMRPFDDRRRGLILGEGCSAVVLERAPQAHVNHPRFYLRGSANYCDTHSISAANPDGSTVRIVISQALRSANLQPHEISALKAHGTASLLNDEAEVAGMKQVFTHLPRLFALKPRIGHTLGACGLNELVLSCSALQERWLPGAPGICVTSSDLGVQLNQEPTPTEPGHFMLNYFGFGGNNTSLVVSNAE